MFIHAYMHMYVHTYERMHATCCMCLPYLCTHECSQKLSKTAACTLCVTIATTQFVDACHVYGNLSFCPKVVHMYIKLTNLLVPLCMYV